MANLPSSIALVYDRVNKWGGAERVLLNLHQLFPQAELFTSVYNPTTARWAQYFPKIHTSFLQHFSFVQTHHEYFPFLMPLAFEQFNFDRFDLVISLTSAEAKGIITKPHTKHLCYCLTPTRYLYTNLHQVPFWAKPLTGYLKWWDQVAYHRPDKYIAISQTVCARIKKFYGQDSTVVYPPLPNLPTASNDQLRSHNYFLIVSRLVEYKNLSLIIEVFNQLKLPLVVVGTGQEEHYLKSIAGINIRFVGFVSDQQLSNYYSNCKALIYFHEEDFGLVPLEAQSFGKPVIAMSQGGATETVVHLQTGLLINSLHELAQTVKHFNTYRFDSLIIKKHAQRFSFSRFKEQFLSEIVKL